MHGPGLLHLPTRCFEEALSSASDIDITGKDHPNARLCTQRRFCPFTLTLALQEEPQPYTLVLQVQYSNGRVCTTVCLSMADDKMRFNCNPITLGFSGCLNL